MLWKEQKQRLGSDIHHLVSGKVSVARAYWNGLRSRDDPPGKEYIWQVDMPGRERKGYAGTLDEAKHDTEAAFAEALEAAGLMRKP